MSNTHAILPWLIALTTLNTLLLCAANACTLAMPPRPRAIAAKLFYYSAYVAQAFLLAFIISLISGLFALLLQHDTRIIIVSSVINLVILMFCLCNSVVHYKYHFNVNLDILKLVFGPGGSEVVQIHPLEYLIFALALVIIISICVAGQLLCWYLSVKSGFNDYIRYAAMLLLVIYLCNQLCFILLCIKRKMTVLQYATKIFMYSALAPGQWLKKIGLIKEPLFRALHNRSALRYPIKPIIFRPEKKPLNILLITVDALRFDVVTQILMPNVYQFSQSSSRFDKHFSGGNTTQPGIFSLFYGIPATYWHSALKQRQAPALITTLQQRNYQLAIYASATLRNPPFHQTVFSSITDLSVSTEGSHPLMRDQSITESMSHFLQTRDANKPFFGFLFYDSTHGYYAIPDLPEHFTPTKQMNHITVNNKSDPTPLKNAYLCALYEVDRLIAKVLQTLAQQQLLDSTIVMITGDHGQEFNDLHKNYWEHPSNFARFQTKVPLIVHHPQRAAEYFNYFTTHNDIVPTLMQDALGVTTATSDYSVGNHLFEQSHVPFTVMANYTNYALMDPLQIVEIQKSGLYTISDHDMNYQESATLAADTQAKLIESITRFRKLPL